MKNPNDFGKTLLLLEGGLDFLWQSSTFCNIKIISCQITQRNGVFALSGDPRLIFVGQTIAGLLINGLFIIISYYIQEVINEGHSNQHYVYYRQNFRQE